MALKTLLLFLILLFQCMSCSTHRNQPPGKLKNKSLWRANNFDSHLAKSFDYCFNITTTDDFCPYGFVYLDKTGYGQAYLASFGVGHFFTSRTEKIRSLKKDYSLEFNWEGYLNDSIVEINCRIDSIRTFQFKSYGENNWKIQLLDNGLISSCECDLKPIPTKATSK